MRHPPARHTDGGDAQQVLLHPDNVRKILRHPEDVRKLRHPLEPVEDGFCGKLKLAIKVVFGAFLCLPSLSGSLAGISRIRYS